MIQTILDFLKLNRHRNRYTKRDINRYQWKEIVHLFDYAKTHSSYYQSLYKDKILTSWQDFHDLPTINKAIMMDHFTDLNTVGLIKEEVMSYALKREADQDYLGYYKDQFVIGLSSGTSGNKGFYVTPKSLTKRLPGVFLARSGLSLRDLPMRILFCLRVFSQGFDDINASLIKLTYRSTMTNPKVLIEDINSKKINILMAPPSLVRLLIPYADQISVKLKKIITYAEVLSAADKQQFETVFKTKVIEIYQASEGQIASACPCGHLHINEDLVYVELYDSQGHLIIEPHVVGQKMIVTNLINKAQPLIRYEMNDMIVLDDPCPCGSHFRTIEKVLGRTDDLIYAHGEDGQAKVIFPDLFARWIITTSDQIREFQVTQSTIGKATIKIDAPEDFDLNILEEKLKHACMSLQCSMIFTFEITTLSQPKHQHKFKRFISTIKSQELS